MRKRLASDYSPEELAKLRARQRELYHRNAKKNRLRLRDNKRRSRAKYERAVRLGKRQKIESESPEYITWISMIARCTNKKNSAYRHYGERGISVCPRWMQSYRKFLDDMGRRPNKSMQIDRINNDGNYEPGNCRWTTATENTRNRRCTPRIKGAPMAEWAEKLGIRYDTLFHRYMRGLPDEKIVFSGDMRKSK